MSIEKDSNVIKLDSRHERERPLWRRPMAIGAVAIAALVADGLYTIESQQEHGTTEIMLVSDPQNEELHGNAAWIVMSGFKMGWDDSYDIAENLSPALSERGHVYAVGYSNEGVDREEIYDRVITLADSQGIDTLNFYGHSSGNLISIDVTGLINERRDDIDVKTIISDSGPTGGDASIFDKTWLHSMAATEDAGIPIPTAARFVLEGGQRLINKDERSFGQIAEQTLAEVRPTAVSNKLIQSMSNYILDYDRSKYELIPDDTNVYLISNVEDAMVDQRYVRQDLRNLLGDKLDAIYATNNIWPAHASPQYNPEQYMRIIRNINESFMPIEDTEIEVVDNTEIELDDQAFKSWGR